MKVYLAALLYNDFREGSPFWPRLNEREKQAVFDVKYLLDSYHYIHKPRMVERIQFNWETTNRKIFLDSGAFSSFTQGIDVDIDAYCAYCKEHAEWIEVASVLDAIGDADGTWRNQKYIESQGINVLPCYHYGEPEEVLAYYVEHYEYITIGGMVPISTPQLRIWLDRIWGKWMTHKDGTPKLKVHGFGLTSIPLMARYPWYSVDSSSWVQLGGIGNVFFPKWGMMSVSELAPQLKETNKHIDNLPPEHRDVLYGIIEDLGFDIERMRKEHLTRKCFNMVTYSMMSETATDRFIVEQEGLF